MPTWRGKASWFGGPDDEGVAPDEGLAFIYDTDQAPHLFLAEQPEGTTGLARRLNPDVHYIACRWDYERTPKVSLLGMMVKVRSPKTGLWFTAYPADWGPHEDTGRIADLSPGLMESLGIQTDDEVVVTFVNVEDELPAYMPYHRIAISSGHGLLVRGAEGILDEVDEARDLVEGIANELRERGVEATTFHDDTSTSQSENLERIVGWHNGQERDLDISVHFNAYEYTAKPMGTEVLYVTAEELADTLSSAIASCGFPNRGAKYRDDLYFLNNTSQVAVLLEVCFVDSEADAEVYTEQAGAIARIIADVLGGSLEGE